MFKKSEVNLSSEDYSSEHLDVNKGSLVEGSQGVLVKQEVSESRGKFSPAGCQIHPEDTQSGQIILK